MTSRTKEVDPAALAGLTTGILMTDFGAMAEAAEWIMGHPIWTHQYPRLAGALKAAVLAQFPAMPTDCLESWEKTRDDVRRRFGTTVSVRKGDGDAAPSPFDLWPEVSHDPA